MAAETVPSASSRSNGLGELRGETGVIRGSHCLQARLFAGRERQRINKSHERLGGDRLAARELLQLLVSIRHTGSAEHGLHSFAEHFPRIANVLVETRRAGLDFGQAAIERTPTDERVPQCDAE